MFTVTINNGERPFQLIVTIKLLYTVTFKVMDSYSFKKVCYISEGN